MADPGPTPILATDRLILRAPGAEDAPRMAVLADDDGVARMTTSIPHPFQPGMAEDFIARMAVADRARDMVLAVEHRREGLIGVLGFHTQDGPAPELGYWLGRPYWGQGLATEAATAALDWAGTGWRKRLILAGHFADNTASGQVLVKAGFLYTGEVLARYSMARNEEAATRMMVWLP
jgi:RimJ/RimL family protein N-acetyltransferase